VILIEPTTISTPIWDKAIAYLDALNAGGSPRLEPYRDRLRAFRETLQSADEHGKSPDLVADTIVEALTTSSPDTRYVVGAGGKLATALRPLIPDRLADKLAERAGETCALEDGPAIPSETARRLACDATITPAHHARDGTID
jgi:hypothetical protein